MVFSTTWWAWDNGWLIFFISELLGGIKPDNDLCSYCFVELSSMSVFNWAFWSEAFRVSGWSFHAKILKGFCLFDLKFHSYVVGSKYLFQGSIRYPEVQKQNYGRALQNCVIWFKKIWKCGKINTNITDDYVGNKFGNEFAKGVLDKRPFIFYFIYLTTM